MALCASPTALQLSLNSFASRGNKSFSKGVLLLELVLCLEFKEVVSYEEDTYF